LAGYFRENEARILPEGWGFFGKFIRLISRFLKVFIKTSFTSKSNTLT
jgi:hypothetical protein